MGTKYARGRRAWGICGRCGGRGFLNEMVFDGHILNMRVHRACFEPQHPQEMLPAMDDPVALWRPSPETFNPPTAPVLEGEIVQTYFLLQENGDLILLESGDGSLEVEH